MNVQRSIDTTVIDDRVGSSQQCDPTHARCTFRGGHSSAASLDTRELHHPSWQINVHRPRYQAKHGRRWWRRALVNEKPPRFLVDWLAITVDALACRYQSPPRPHSHRNPAMISTNQIDATLLENYVLFLASQSAPPVLRMHTENTVQASPSMCRYLRRKNGHKEAHHISLESARDIDRHVAASTPRLTPPEAGNFRPESSRRPVSRGPAIDTCFCATETQGSFH